MLVLVMDTRTLSLTWSKEEAEMFPPPQLRSQWTAGQEAGTVDQSVGRSEDQTLEDSNTMDVFGQIRL